MSAWKGLREVNMRTMSIYRGPLSNSSLITGNLAAVYETCFSGFKGIPGISSRLFLVVSSRWTQGLKAQASSAAPSRERLPTLKPEVYKQPQHLPAASVESGNTP